MDTLNMNQLDALAAEIAAIVERRAKVGAAYATEFAAYAAGFGASFLTSPDPQGMERFRAQARAVMETLDEISDQASEEILEDVLGGLRFVIAVAGRAALTA